MFTSVYEPMSPTLQLRPTVFLSCLCNLYTNQYENLKSCLFKKQFLLTLYWPLCLSDWMYRICVHAKLLQSCPTLCHAMDCSPPDSSVHRILQARMPEWVAMSSFRGSSWARDQTWGSCIAGGFFTAEPLGSLDILCLSIKFSTCTAPRFLSLTSSLTLHNIEWETWMMRDGLQESQQWEPWESVSLNLKYEGVFSKGTCPFKRMEKD